MAALWLSAEGLAGGGRCGTLGPVARVLVIEDDRRTAHAVCQGLRGEGFDAVAAEDGLSGSALLDSERFDAVVLDWMLPARDGLSILKNLRARGGRVPVLLLTARDAVEDRVLGLESGADDYLVKPFAFAELLARVRALLRRTTPDESLRWQVADLALDLKSRRVTRAGGEVVLTPREFDLLACLLRHQGQTVTRAMLAREVWGETQRAAPLHNAIDVHIAHLRRKMDDGRQPRLLQTVRGVGFVLREEASS